jgi:hypothetical protein
MPTPQSNHNDLLDGVTAVVTGLGLTLSTTVPPTLVTVIKGKVPKDEAGLESIVLPVIYVTTGDRPVRSVWNDTGGERTNNVNTKVNTYVIELTQIAAGNLDNTTGLPDYTNWRQQLVRAVGNPSQVSVTGTHSEVFEVNYDMDPPIDRPAWLANYDVSNMNISFDVVEPSSGTG